MAVDVEAELGGIRAWTTGRILARRAELHADRVFLRFAADGREFSYGQVDRRTNGTARALGAWGIGKGSHVALLAPNSPEFLVAFFALGKLGAVAVPINTAAKGLLLQYYLSHTDCTAAIVADACLDDFAAAARELPALKRVLVIDDLARATALLRGLPLEVTAFPSEEESSEPVDPAVRHTDLACLMFTSGTTGPSKAIMMPHGMVWHWGRQGVQNRNVLASDIEYVCMPLFHANALLLSVATAMMAGTEIVLDERFSVSRFWDRLRAYGVTRFNAIGAMVQFLWSQPPSAADRDHRVRLCSLAPAPAFLHEFKERFGVDVMGGYALSDYAYACALPPNAPAGKAFTLGRVNAGVALRIVDDDDFDVPTGEVGEIVLRVEQPGATPLGYYKMPDATLAAWRNLWFHTGDRGCLDADGYLTLKDRKKDSIRRRGENISAYEVESVIGRHPAVAQVAVYPVRSEHSEDEVAATVVLAPGAQLDGQALVAFCKSNMAAHMVPRFVEFADGMPLTPTGKIEKYKLRQRAEDDRARLWDRSAEPRPS
jgi:crotonobetaine/carnitine-CoA ligase